MLKLMMCAMMCTGLLLTVSACAAATAPRVSQTPVQPATTDVRVPSPPATSSPPSSPQSSPQSERDIIDGVSADDNLANSDKAGSDAAEQDYLRVSKPTRSGSLQSPALVEVSGLARSHRRDDLLWAVNDSGQAASVHAVGLQGEDYGEWPITVRNRDWEDMTSLKHNGEAYLLLGDIGDNLGIHDEYAIHVIAEPNLDTATATDKKHVPLKPIETIRFRYVDGSHNAEAMAYADGLIYIVTKEPLGINGHSAGRLYQLPFSLTSQQTLQVAEHIATLHQQNISFEARLAASLAGVDLNHVTAFDIQTEQGLAYLLTYRHVIRIRRDASQDWASALAGKGQRIHNHNLTQAEAMTIDRHGQVWFTSEDINAPLWVLPDAPPTT